MNTGVFLVFLALGAGAIALWVDARVKGLAPSSLRGALLHVGASIVLGQLAVPLLTRLIIEGGSAAYSMAAIFGVGFPALTYCFLASIWIIKIVQGSLRH
jgi:hypothetical protein